MVWTQKTVPEIDESRHIYISDTKPDVNNQKMFLVYTPMIELKGGLLVIPPEKLIQIAMEREAQPSGTDSGLVVSNNQLKRQTKQIHIEKGRHNCIK